MTTEPVSRREFLGDVALAGAAFTIVPRHVLGRGYRAPSDTLNIACIGVGGKGESDVQGVSTENIYALCDVDLHSAETSFRRFPKAKQYRDYREMLDKESDRIDAVTVTIPDHSHAAAAMLAMKHGKHVFCQKPLAHTLTEVQALMDAAARTKVATQMGNQGHAGAGTRLIRELVEAGAIGAVREVHYWTDRPIWPQGLDRPLEAYEVPPWLDWNLWLGPAPARPYHPAYAPFTWRGWWDFGCGALGDIAAHAMDAAFWTLGLGFPLRIEAETTRRYPETAPKLSRIVYEFGARGTRGPVRVVWHDGGQPRPGRRSSPRSSTGHSTPTSARNCGSAATASSSPTATATRSACSTPNARPSSPRIRRRRNIRARPVSTRNGFVRARAARRPDPILPATPDRSRRWCCSATSPFG